MRAIFCFFILVPFQTIFGQNLDQFRGTWNGTLNGGMTVVLNISVNQNTVSATGTFSGITDSLTYLGYKSSINGIYLWTQRDLACICLFPRSTSYILGYFEGDSARKATMTKTTSIKNSPTGSIPSYQVLQNYPNPFNPSTKIAYEVKTRSHVKIHIFNELGQIVNILQEKIVDRGFYEVEWTADKSTSGIYFYRIEIIPFDNPSKQFVETKKMVLLR